MFLYRRFEFFSVSGAPALSAFHRKKQTDLTRLLTEVNPVFYPFQVTSSLTTNARIWHPRLPLEVGASPSAQALQHSGSTFALSVAPLKPLLRHAHLPHWSQRQWNSWGPESVFTTREYKAQYFGSSRATYPQPHRGPSRLIGNGFPSPSVSRLLFSFVLERPRSRIVEGGIGREELHDGKN